MTNDTLLSIPLFVFMGYIMERAALVDRMFHSVQLAFRRVPASLAVTTLLVCAFWGIASGIVGAVVVLMGVIAMRPMLNAGYDVRLAAGAITAGGTLGILIPPSVMLIVYAAVAGQSIVKLYAAAMLPGFFLTFLYLVYILGWAIINPQIAPKLPPDQYRVAVPEYLQRWSAGRVGASCRGSSAAALRPAPCGGARAELGRRPGIGADRRRTCSSLSVPLMLTWAPSPRPGGTWSSTTRPRAAAGGAPSARRAAPPRRRRHHQPRRAAPGRRKEDESRRSSGPAAEPPDGGRDSGRRPTGRPRRCRRSAQPTAAPESGRIPAHFYAWFWGLAAASTSCCSTTSGAWTASSSRS